MFAGRSPVLQGFHQKGELFAVLNKHVAQFVVEELIHDLRTLREFSGVSASFYTLDSAIHTMGESTVPERKLGGVYSFWDESAREGSQNVFAGLPDLVTESAITHA